tara:strand:- start:323 stop:955 length:633 start_codon:yes stop_codon:yes gene_type:complete
MYLKTSFYIVLISSVAFIAGCGGGEESQDTMSEAEPMAEAEPAPEPMAESFDLGGGTATEVHPGQAGSPHVQVAWVVNDANITITYGRPYLKERVVGESVEPMSDRFWRLGADEATTLTTDTDLMVGGTHIPAGEYTLFTQHMSDEFHLIFNSETGQWGTAYNSDHDVAHIAMAVSDLNPPADQLTLSIGDGELGFEWGQMAASVELMVH